MDEQVDVTKYRKYLNASHSHTVLTHWVGLFAVNTNSAVVKGRRME